MLAVNRKDQATAIDLLTRLLALEPEDQVALRLRGDLYWRMGEHELARDDDDRLAEIERLNGPSSRTFIELP